MYMYIYSLISQILSAHLHTISYIKLKYKTFMIPKNFSHSIVIIYLATKSVVGLDLDCLTVMFNKLYQAVSR